MYIFKTIRETTRYLSEQKNNGFTIGFVPTMGALHAGHLDLISRSVKDNDITVCSIFVNPIQFNNPDDLKKYPRNLDADIELLTISGCDVLFAPEVGEMYPEGENYSLEIDFGDLDKVMEGQFRPGHFRGVAIVVKKLFDIVLPSRTYFGKKDYQQLAIVEFMVAALGIPVAVVACETVREADGLAMSSRNVRLTALERQQAPRIHQVLCQLRDKLQNTSIHEMKSWASQQIEQGTEMKVEYFEIANSTNLMPAEVWNGQDRLVALTAVYLGSVRLIDNLELF